MKNNQQDSINIEVRLNQELDKLKSAVEYINSAKESAKKFEQQIEALKNAYEKNMTLKDSIIKELNQLEVNRKGQNNSLMPEQEEHLKSIIKQEVHKVREKYELDRKIHNKTIESIQTALNLIINEGKEFKEQLKEEQRLRKRLELKTTLILLFLLFVALVLAIDIASLYTDRF